MFLAGRNFMKVFHVTWTIKIPWLTAHLFLICLLGLQVLPFSSWIISTGRVLSYSPFPWGIFTIQVLVLLLLLFIACLLLVAWGVSAFAITRAQLIFKEDMLIFKSLDHLTFILNDGLKPFKIPYNQIANIKTNIPMGKIEIFELTGRHQVLFPLLFGPKYGENVLVELQKYVSSEVFESGLGFSGMMEKRSQTNRLNVATTLFFGIIYLWLFILDPFFSSRPWFPSLNWILVLLVIIPVQYVVNSAVSMYLSRRFKA
jgi:hypothetical protein